jgi:predicted 3-demethylubiquinone-9 3-methyltransferase (glyoxalase superfamily)
MATIKNPQAITPFLWFDGRAAEAMQFYTSIFPDSSIIAQRKWGEGTPFPADWIMTGTVVLNGVKMHLFDAGPEFKFTEAISFMVSCTDQKDVDYYWYKLIEDGGQEQPCGWVKDKFGVSWQIVPEQFWLDRVMDGEKSRMHKLMQAMYTMKKLDIAALEAAYNS